MSRIFIRYLKFIGTGTAGTIVEMLVLWILSHFIFDGYWGEYIISPVISFQLAVVVNYIISYFYVWKDRRDRSDLPHRRRFFRLFMAYDLAGSAVFIFRLGILLLIEVISGWNVIICNILSMTFSGILNFVINNLLIFKKSSGKQTIIQKK